LIVKRTTTVTKGAILYPLISRATWCWLALFLCSFIALLAFVLPPNLEMCTGACQALVWLYEGAMSFKGIAGLGAGSYQPFVITVAYFVSVLSGLFLGLFACFVRADLDAFYRFLSRKSGARRVLYLACLVFLWTAAIFLKPVEVGTHQLSYEFWQLLKSSRGVLLFYCEGMFGLTTGSVVWIIGEIRYLFGTKRK